MLQCSNLPKKFLATPGRERGSITRPVQENAFMTSDAHKMAAAFLHADHHVIVSTEHDYQLMSFCLLPVSHFLKNVYSTMYSQAVTHPSTNIAQCCLTSVIRRELVFSTWYGRRQYIVQNFGYWTKFWISLASYDFSLTSSSRYGKFIMAGSGCDRWSVA